MATDIKQRISTQQQQAFKENGFLHLPEALSSSMLERLQTSVKRLEQQLIEKYKQGTKLANANIADSNTLAQPKLLRYNHIYQQIPELMIELLASPILTTITKQLCGENGLPLSADIVFKPLFPQTPVLWHQDAPTETPNSHIVIGIYLDDARVGDGCLRYVKGSHHKIHNIAELAQQYGWLIPDSEECPAKAGDIIVHSGMVLHGSGLKYHPSNRRTLYIEMQDAKELIQFPFNSTEWFNLRKKWMHTVAEQQNPEHILSSSTLAVLMQKLVQTPKPSIPANYAAFPVTNDNYPTPKHNFSKLPFSLISTMDTGNLGIYQMKRFWHSALADNQDILLADQHKNCFLFDALGIGLHQGLNYINEHKPDLEQFEQWVSNTSPLLNFDMIQRLNGSLSGLPSPKIAKTLNAIDTYPDVLTKEQLIEWENDGYVILKNAVDIEDCIEAEQAIWRCIKATPNSPDSWYKKNQDTMLTELTQHSTLIKNRQNLKIRKAFSQIWQNNDLCCSVKPCNFRPPLKPGTAFHGPDLHWDIDLNQPEMFGTRGLLYLSNQSALSLVPGFHHKLKHWLANLKVGQDPQMQNLHSLGSKVIAAQAGDLIIWHQALPHGYRPNLTQLPTITQPVNYYPFELQSIVPCKK